MKLTVRVKSVGCLFSNLFEKFLNFNHFVDYAAWNNCIIKMVKPEWADRRVKITEIKQGKKTLIGFII